MRWCRFAGRWLPKSSPEFRDPLASIRRVGVVLWRRVCGNHRHGRAAVVIAGRRDLVNTNPFCERQGASRRWRSEPAASALLLTHFALKSGRKPGITIRALSRAVMCAPAGHPRRAGSHGIIRDGPARASCCQPQNLPVYLAPTVEFPRFR